MAARDDGRHDHGAVDPSQRIRPGFDDVPADLVSERERKLVLGPHPVVVVAEIGVAEPSTGDIDRDLARRDGRGIEVCAHQRRFDRGHKPTMGCNRHRPFLLGFPGFRAAPVFLDGPVFL
jgi:hypothetical protein